MVQILIIAKAPRVGFVKTRLCPPFSLAQAASLAAAALADTLDTVVQASALGSVGRPVLVLDGDPVLVDAPIGVRVVRQSGDGLDERLAAAFTDTYRDLPAPMLLIGMDTPQLSPADIIQACDALLADGVDAVIGPATDGGFWALGLHRPDQRVLVGVPMSTPSTGRALAERLRCQGLRVERLHELCDVDDVGGARIAAAAAPWGRFAQLLVRYDAGVAS